MKSGFLNFKKIPTKELGKLKWEETKTGQDQDKKQGSSSEGQGSSSEGNTAPHYGTWPAVREDWVNLMHKAGRAKQRQVL